MLRSRSLPRKMLSVVLVENANAQGRSLNCFAALEVIMTGAQPDFAPTIIRPQGWEARKFSVNAWRSYRPIDTSSWDIPQSEETSGICKNCSPPATFS